MSHTPKPPEMIEGDKVILRRKHTDHAQDTFNLIDRNREHLRPWMPWEEVTTGVADSRGYIELTKKWWDTGSTFDYTVFEKTSGKVAGSFGLHSINWMNRKCDVGYWLGEEFQGKGLATDCIRIGEKIACDLSFHRLNLTCDPRNKKSVAVAIRNGYRHEATLVDDEMIGGALRDTQIYVKFFNPAIEGQLTYNLPAGFSIRECTREELWKFIDGHIEKVFGDEDITIWPESYYSDEEKEKLKALATPQGYKLSVVVLFNGKLAGWSWGQQDHYDSFYMQNSAILPEYRGKGLYTHMMEYVLEKTTNNGFQKIWSRHNVTNNAIIIPKLKAGFQITGTELNDKFGSMLCLAYFPNKTRRQVIEFRAGARPDAKLKELMKL